MITHDEAPVTNIKASPAVDGRSLQQSESQEFARGYKTCALDVYLVATGKLESFDAGDDKFQFIDALLKQIETWQNKQKMMVSKSN